MYVPAVFSNGNVAVGRHHGEAFSNLTTKDQEADLVSGHVNPDGTFTTEMNFINKELILVRHSESENNAHLSPSLDSTLTMNGVAQAQAVAGFISRNIDCRGLVGFSSPFHRCVLTSMSIRKHTGIRFFVKSEIAELTEEFPDCGVEVPCRRDLDIEWDNYLTTIFRREPPDTFLSRLQSFLNSLADRSLVVSHGSVVQTLIEMALGVNVQNIPFWDNSIGNASITHIKNGTVILMAKNVT